MASRIALDLMDCENLGKAELIWSVCCLSDRIRKFLVSHRPWLVSESSSDREVSERNSSLHYKAMRELQLPLWETITMV